MRIPKQLLYGVATSLALGGTTLHAQPSATPAAAPVIVEGVGAIDAVRVTASVEAVDEKNRVVTLKGPRGNVFAIPVSDAVKNLAQVKSGDKVELDYYEALAIDVKTVEATPSLTSVGVAGKAVPGAKPGAVALRKVRLVTNVLGVSSEGQTVLVRGPLGHLAEVKVKDAQLLSGLKNGGQIDLTYVEGVALAVRPLRN